MGFVKVFISFDMEGVAGIVDWGQCRPPGQAYEEGRALLLGEVNAAIDGARPARLDIDFQTADMAQVANWAKGVERSGTRSVRIEGDDPLEVYRSFVGITYITRVAEGR